MKRSEINAATQHAKSCFEAHSWRLPPHPAWDVTDFGLGDFSKNGLVLVNLADEAEYCEKLMYAKKDQTTPTHTHHLKKEDIICRNGQLCLQLWHGEPEHPTANEFQLKVNRQMIHFKTGNCLTLEAGERVTLPPGIYHAFWPLSPECIIGEVSTANNDATDNVFIDPNIGRFPEIEEDCP